MYDRVTLPHSKKKKKVPLETVESFELFVFQYRDRAIQLHSFFFKQQTFTAFRNTELKFSGIFSNQGTWIRD